MTEVTELTDLKAVARTDAFVRRKAAHCTEQTARVVERMLEVLLPHRGKPLAGYMPIRTEVDPLPVMAAMSSFGPVCVPVIQGPDQPLKFRQWTPGCKTEPGAFGAPVPSSGDWIEPEVLMVPLLAFDQNAMRLGYGGGFYDRTLAKLRARTDVMVFGYAYSAQRTLDLPVEPTDQPLDAIVTEEGVFWRMA
ncbi:MAG: 5-formyltetrahydrofolate cyclo-ligase [Litoreibacter sp.]|nr:5-formyltetrahydrofolate cyclo-ligase [Litoreibacter sp.]